jgi:hypothetical protein
MTNMLESMLRNPQMQSMLYPYLPEPMRNPQSIEWMLSNPEVRGWGRQPALAMLAAAAGDAGRRRWQRCLGAAALGAARACPSASPGARAGARPQRAMLRRGPYPSGRANPSLSCAPAPACLPARLPSLRR